MITCEFIGNLGNKLFELWSMYGMAKQNRQEVFWPVCELYPFFKGDFTNHSSEPHYWESNKEVKYHHYEQVMPYTRNYKLKGYWQAEKYWQASETELRQRFEFKDTFLHQVVTKPSLRKLFTKPVICISIRRGDFVGNPVYYQTDINYYLGALVKHYPNYKEYNILLLSDDVHYCHVHFDCLPNAYFADDCTAIEQLALGTMCDEFIISNSTFSWWVAYLANRGNVYRPLHNFGEQYRQHNPEHDFWPPAWQVFDHASYKIPLNDVTFTLPVFADHPDRKQNLDLCVCMLQRSFATNVIVMEQFNRRFEYIGEYCTYIHTPMKVFHRTKMLNEMCRLAGTEIVFNWDCDVFVPPLQILEAVKRMRAGVPFVYPYDGRFARVVRAGWFKQLERFLDVGIFGNLVHFGKGGKPMATTSVGGAVGYLKTAFIDSGMENEFMISYAPEDCERWERWHKLGYDVQRVKGRLYHMDHHVGQNSSNQHPYFKGNTSELQKEREMNSEQLSKYINSTWEWKFAPENAPETHTA